MPLQMSEEVEMARSVLSHARSQLVQKVAGVSGKIGVVSGGVNFSPTVEKNNSPLL